MVRMVTILFSNFMLLWVATFAVDGIISIDDSKDIFQKLLLTATISAVVLTPLLGFAADKIPSTVIAPYAFLLRAACGFGFLIVSDPRSSLATFFCTGLCVFSMLQSICMEVLLMKGMPPKIRGTMMGMYSFFVILGKFTFTLMSGFLFDKVGRTTPFIYMASCDSVAFLVSIILVATGKFKRRKDQEVE